MSEGHCTFFSVCEIRRSGAKNNRSRLATKKPYIPEKLFVFNIYKMKYMYDNAIKIT